MPAGKPVEQILRFDDLAAYGFLTQAGQIGVTPGMIAQLKFWIGCKQKCFVLVGSHPVPAHEKGGGHVIPGEDIINALIEPGRQVRFLAEIEGESDIRSFAVTVIDKVNIGMRQGGSKIGSLCFRQGRSRRDR